MMPVGIRTALPFCSLYRIGTVQVDFRAFALDGVVRENKAEVTLLRRKIVEIALRLQLAGRDVFRLLLRLSGQVPRYHHHGAIAVFGAKASWMLSAPL